jgi:diguanylate cyclase (GGDEF)-like protein
MRLFVKNFLISCLFVVLDLGVLYLLQRLGYFNTKVLIANNFILCFIVCFSCYFKLLKPVVKIYKALKIIDFKDDLVDFTKLDNLQPQGYHETKVIINKFKHLIDAIAERINKINTETYKSEHDILTGCYNRNYLDRVKGSYEASQNFVVCFIDVNNLKRMNDEFGHEAGDILLRAAASKLAYWSKLGDVYRMGGDEFMFVIVNKPLHKVKSLVSTWYKTVGVLNKSTDGFSCLLSYGLAEGQCGMNFDYVMKQADEIMYDMKVRIKKELGEPLR